MPTLPIPLAAQPRRLVFHYDSQRNRQSVWTQIFDSGEGRWSTPTEHKPSDPQCHGMPSASMAALVFSPPLHGYFILVTHLTVSSYGDIRMQGILKMLDSMPQLEELELCRLDILDSTTGPFVRPTHMVSSLKRLAIQACNIPQGLSDAHYDLLFRFLALFERIERLRLVTSMRAEGRFYQPNFHNLRLPTIVHLEAEGFFAHVLLDFCCRGYPVQELVSLHLSRCFSTWAHFHWIAAIVRVVAPTLQHLAFRPNLTASPYGVRDWPALCRDLAEAVAQCPKLRTLEFGLYAHGQPGFAGVYDDATALFRRVLELLPAARLDHLAFVFDVGEGMSPEAVPWVTLDALLSRVCVRHGSPLKVRFYNYDESASDADSRNLNAGQSQPLAPWTDFLDRGFWETRMPMMRQLMAVRGWAAAEPPTALCFTVAVGRYAAPGRIAHSATSRLRALLYQ